MRALLYNCKGMHEFDVTPSSSEGGGSNSLLEKEPCPEPELHRATRAEDLLIRVVVPWDLLTFLNTLHDVLLYGIAGVTRRWPACTGMERQDGERGEM